MNVYSVEIKVVATVYVKASSAEKALQKAQGLHLSCLHVAGHHPESEVEISSLGYGHPDLPEVSLSPVMTLWEAGRHVELAAENANRTV